jgi:hypothetical protein
MSATVEVVDMYSHGKKQIVFCPVSAFGWWSIPDHLHRCAFRYHFLPHQPQFQILTLHFVRKPLVLLSSMTLIFFVLTTIWLLTHVKKLDIVRVSFVLRFYLNAFLFPSFLNAKTITLKNTRGIVIPYSINNILPDVMITVGLCILLRNRRAEVQASRYVLIPYFRPEGRV